MMVRDERQIIIDCIGHLLGTVGVDRVYVADNDSVDGTPEILQRLAAKTDRVVLSHAPGGFRQAAVLTDLAARAMADGAAWLLPSDADEFLWFAPGASLAQACRRPGIGGYNVTVRNFVQARGIVQDWLGSIITMCVSAVPFGSVSDGRAAVEAGRIPFVRINYPTKLLLRAKPGLQLHHGHHEASGVAGPLVPLERGMVLHAPIRSRQDLRCRIEHGRRVAQVMPDPSQNWHVKRIAAIGEAGLAEEWRSNSFVPMRRLPEGMRWDLRLSRIGVRQRLRQLAQYRGCLTWLQQQRPS